MTRFAVRKIAWTGTGFWPLMVAVLFGTTTACDPCAGVVTCGEGVSARASGRIIDFPSGQGVGGVRMTLVSEAGDSVSTVTTSEGFWRAELASSGRSPSVTVQVRVQAPNGGREYRVSGVKLPVSGRRDATVELGRWFVTPQVRFIGELRPRVGVTVAGAAVTVDRIGGVTGTVSGVRTTAGADGRFYFEAPAGDLGTMVLRLTVSARGLSRPVVRDGVLAPVLYRDTVPGVQVSLPVGAGLPYVARIVRRGSEVNLSSVRAVFRRTGGVRTTVDTVASVSTELGLISLALTPTATGEVIGDLELRPPAPLAPRIIRGIRLPTVDDDSLRLALIAGVGAQVRSAFELYERTSFAPLAGVDVEFQPLSGPLTVVQRGRTDAAGRFGVTAPVALPGPVIGNLVVKASPLRAPEVIAGVRLVAAEDDSVRLGGYLGVGPSLLYVGVVQDWNTFQGVGGGTAEFRRTGGVPVRDSVFRWPVTPDGYFRIAPTPLADGELVGTLTLRLPPPYRDRVFTGIRLQTFTSDSSRSAGIFRVRSGALVQAVFELYERTSFAPLAGVEVEYQPISGPLTAIQRGRTDAAGRFGVTAAVASSGPVIGNLVVKASPPRAPEVIAGVRLVAAEDDSVRLGGYLGVGPSLLYVGAVQDRITFQGIGGGTAEFRRTSGVPVRDSVFRWPVTPEGYFRVAPTPLADGEVVGTLTLRLPPPYRDTSFTGIRLRTFTNDSTRAAGIFRVVSP